MNLKMKSILALAVLAISAGCTTMPANNVRESQEVNVKGCKMLGPVNGSDSVFVGLSSAIGSKNAKAKAMMQAVNLNATDVVWTSQGTSMTSEWIGKAYVCK